MGPAPIVSTIAMSYLVLARKWRPKTFDEVVGQATVTRTLKNALASRPHRPRLPASRARAAWARPRPRASWPRPSTARRATGPRAEPCGECPSCQEIADGTSLDVQEIDGATNNGVEQVRELRESARYNPARDRFKIWIIDEVHMLSTGAFNALLKTLEEPPPRVKFIFATTEYHKIPDTILSRCQQYDFRLIPARELLAHLRKVADGEEHQGLRRGPRAGSPAPPRAAPATRCRSSTRCSPSAATRCSDEDIQALLGPHRPRAAARPPRAPWRRATAWRSSTWWSGSPTTAPTTATSPASCCCTSARSCS